MSHQRSESYSKVIIDNTEGTTHVDVEFSIQTSILQRLKKNFPKDWEQDLIQEIINNYQVKGDCKLKQDPLLKKSFATGYLSLIWALDCQKEFIEIEFDLFVDEDPTHTHITTFLVNSEAIPEKIFTSADRHWAEGEVVSGEGARFESFFDYLSLGFNHILSGYDHLAFLLALLILNPRVKKIFYIVTGFTVGHSITLVLGALGLIQPASQLVEALIGYSILIIAIECIASISGRYRLYNNILLLASILLIISLLIAGDLKYLIGLLGVSIFSYCYIELSSKQSTFVLPFLVTVLFGLVHGFGFAGNLSSLDLMEGRLLPAILGFNLGVELGQLLVVFFLLLIFLVLSSFVQKRKDLLRVVIASGLTAVGTFWFLERII